MNVIDLVKGYRGAAGIVRPMDLDKDAEIYESLENYEACKKKLEGLGGSIDNVYVTDAAFNKVYYIEKENGVYFELFPFCVEYIEMIQFEQRLQIIRKRQLEYLNKQEYSLFYTTIPESMRVYDFQHRYLTIPQEKVAEVWLHVYTRIDYGFSAWDEDVIKYVIKHAPPHNKEGEYTIYRGEGTTSTPVEKAFSWTTDINVALFFAAMWEGKRVWKAKVKAENIVFFIDKSDEKEVIVQPDNIESLEDMGLYSGERENILKLLNPVLDNCLEYGSFIPEIFDECHNLDIHGESHTARVLINALLIAEELECLNDFEIQLLATAAVFHDCGRQSDKVETGHGERSAEFAMKSDFVNDRFCKDGKAVLYTLIACHDISDEKGIEYIEEHIEDSYLESAKLLYNILKDADALDRYRLSGYYYEFDFNMLRLEESRRLPLATAAMLHGKVEEILLGS